VITWLEAQTNKKIERLRKSLRHTRNRSGGGGGKKGGGESGNGVGNLTF